MQISISIIIILFIQISICKRRYCIKVTAARKINRTALVECYEGGGRRRAPPSSPPPQKKKKERKKAQPKADRCPSSKSHFSLFNCCLSGLCESDDVFFQFDLKKRILQHWFVKQDCRKMSALENEAVFVVTNWA